MSDEKQYENHSEESTEGAAEGRHHGHTDWNGHCFSHKRDGYEKAMLVSSDIAFASAAFMFLMAGLIVIAIIGGGRAQRIQPSHLQWSPTAWRR
jgi:ABC-type transport system involved in cytochrome bd biosynthesis fused ATPase/permease subunit